MMTKKIAIYLLSCLLLNTSLQAASTPDSMSQLLSKRYSGYEFDTSRSVSHEQLQKIVEAGRLAPSSYNEQPWSFIICDRNTNQKAYDKALSTLVELNQGWAKNAPVLVISVATNKSTQNGETNRWAPYDTGAAAFGMMLQATSLGLMAHQMGGFDEVKVRKEFSIPNDFTPMSVMAIGYPAANETQKDRKRKAISENFFSGTWGKEFK